MKDVTLGILGIVVFIASGCATLEQAPPATSIPLPAIKSYGIDVSDGIDKSEAERIAGRYLEHYVNMCGMPDEVERRGDYWITKLWIGIIPCHFSGTFWISQRTGEVMLQPPPKGLSPDEKRRIEFGKQIAKELNGN